MESQTRVTVRTRGSLETTGVVFCRHRSYVAEWTPRSVRGSTPGHLGITDDSPGSREHRYRVSCPHPRQTSLEDSFLSVHSFGTESSGTGVRFIFL